MSLRSGLHKAWQTYAQFCALLGLAIAFAYALAYFSAGVGAAIVVDGPPQGAFTYPDGPQGRPRIRVALGDPIVYDSTWRVLQGGCERRVTNTFSQGGDTRGFRIVQTVDGEPYPVGLPGRHRVTKPTPAGLTSGIWRFRVEGVVFCPTVTHRPVTLADFDVDVYDPNGPVVVPIGSVKLVSAVVPVGGPLAYRLSYTRTEAIRSEVLNTYISVGPTPSGTPDVVIDRRPTAGMGVGEHRDIDISTAIPEAVHAGRWRLSQVIVTQRPGGQARYDPQFSVEIEVVP